MKTLLTLHIRGTSEVKFKKLTNNGISKRPLAIYERAQKVLASSHDTCTAHIWYPDCARRK